MIVEDDRQTKVILSLPPTSLSDNLVTQLKGEKVDSLRIVYSPEQNAGILEFIKKFRASIDTSIPIVLDIATWSQGAVVGEKSLAVSYGKNVRATPEGGGGDFEILGADWTKVFMTGELVYVGFGAVVLKVLEISQAEVIFEVCSGGDIHPAMELHVPATKDRTRNRVTSSELRSLLVAGIDFLVIPGEWPDSDMRRFREALLEVCDGEAPWLIAKIDSKACWESFQESRSVISGVMISRREMSLTTDPATVPMITKEIVQTCNERALLVMVASEMLASMRYNSTPTRAEVSDVANAVIDGTDAVIISEEVANGPYRLKALSVMDRTIGDIEQGEWLKPNWEKKAPSIVNEMDGIAFSAYRTAERIKAKAIVCITRGGNTALRLSSYRVPVPVIAVTFSNAMMRRLALVRGVEALFLDMDPNLDEILPTVSEKLQRESWLQKGDSIIFVALSLSPVGREASNLFSIQSLH